MAAVQSPVCRVMTFGLPAVVCIERLFRKRLWLQALLWIPRTATECAYEAGRRS